MASSTKTWLPRLKFIANLLCNYIRRYEEKIKSRMTEPQQVILDAALAACEALDVVLDLLVSDGT